MNEDEDALEDLGEEDGLWFDFTFVEFLKTNYSTFVASYRVDWKLISFSQSLYSGQSSSTPARTTLAVSEGSSSSFAPR